MTSRERLIAAIRHQEVDHIPLYFKVYDFEPPHVAVRQDPYKRAERWLSMGIDDILIVPSPLIAKKEFWGQGDPAEFSKNVGTRTSVVHEKSEEYPLIVKEYYTPGGTLRHVVRKTNDWDSNENIPYDHGGDDLLVFDDFNVSRSKKFLVQNEDDLRKLKYLFRPLSGTALSDYRVLVNSMKKKSRGLGLLDAACASVGTDAVIWLCGVENAILMAHDKPDMFQELLEVIHQRDKLATEICLECGVDMIIRRGWYEGCDFWSPANYRQYFLPKAKEIGDLVHQAGKLYGYLLTSGIMPILPDLLEIGHDVHFYVDDVQGGADLAKVKRSFKNKIAILGGINGTVMLESASPDVIKESVYRAVDILGKDGGFILSPTGSLYSHTPWESVRAVIDAWNMVKDRPS